MESSRCAATGSVSECERLFVSVSAGQQGHFKTVQTSYNYVSMDGIVFEQRKKYNSLFCVHSRKNLCVCVCVFLCSVTVVPCACVCTFVNIHVSGKHN